MVSNKDEQRMFEQQWIDKLKPTLNQNRAYGMDIDRYKERQKEYIQRPEVKQKKKEYAREYHQRPEVKQKQNEYNQRPEVKQKQKEYARAYYQRPEIQQKRSEYARAYSKAHGKEYYEKRKDIKKCVCGSNVNHCQYGAVNNHYCSSKHINFMKNNPQ